MQKDKARHVKLNKKTNRDIEKEAKRQTATLKMQKDKSGLLIDCKKRGQKTNRDIENAKKTKHDMSRFGSLRKN